MLCHIDDDAVRILVQRDAVLVEVFGELVVDVVAGAVEVGFADLTVDDDFFAEAVVGGAVVDDPVDTGLDTAFGAGDFFFRSESHVVVGLLGDGLDDPAEVEAVLAPQKRDLEFLGECQWGC